MQLHELKPKHYDKKRKRVGRGGKRGTYSGRGIKGQKSRAGRKPRISLAGGTIPLKSFPKKRGAGKKTEIKKGVKLFRLRQKPAIINLRDIGKRFKDNEIVSFESLLKKGLISKIRKKITPKIKILGKGELKLKNLKFKNLDLSRSAAEKIKKAGGLIL
ncbi:MAG: hypothetical protein A3A94_02310 [Candidatus Portnoybacteria bacterium RIFCSPLOWO2_01_FULL_43_11]|uniref:Large ribosomal subunit protein uL15 n=4 Tax=Candidatus Portnoyibacteriota TaxID=1817913 RepID=A0A1G2FC41_9BACT|nr:MAG: hypothetical protein A2815_02535 [Candidatus Portnoybacteria bacterium RIFCSPHIGHO2_01_FULL_40_12b]OGZ36187.1 MAG: hypothetical protein A3D38_00430 [Candidatus Portnoybacteria bacterium RIFCSPHIGHO2_02_FULL_40_23]OGZ38845.1 MAG: hypothetical protein A3A94_02310 [Candidatus Portnoybacteria bacterium RIFCSPLOWO2_01_FULL_43_11]OGZ39435.1 MAG: hypothetical protein A3E90_01545 [Candidatus Portnoybacteria bacterium RIFCSPHIGHO2_12_FULL_40_11]OGZ40541.1 MAG: hypothetical protein A3I20_00645 [C